MLFKPSVALIDLTLPISRDIVDCIILAEGIGTSPINSGRLDKPVTFSGSPTWDSTDLGPAILVSPTNSIEIQDQNGFVSTDFTVRMIHRPVSLSGSYTAIIDKGTGSGADSGRAFSVFVNASGNISYLTVGASNAFSGSMATGMSVGSTWDVVFSRKGTSLSIYVNGILITSVTSSGITPNATTMSVGRNQSGGTGGYNAKISGFWTWRRALSAGEIFDLAIDPWQPLIPLQNWAFLNSSIPSAFILPYIGMHPMGGLRG